MKTSTLIVPVNFRRALGSALLYILLLLTVTLGRRAAGQTYSMDWFTIDGGGGMSAAGTYSINGTIGQPDAGTMSGSSFTLQGGFWPGIHAPSPTGRPTLFIQLSGGDSVIISWSPATPGFVLEETTSLVSPSWSTAPTGNPTAPIPATGQAKFYRLRKP